MYTLIKALHSKVAGNLRGLSLRRKGIIRRSQSNLTTTSLDIKDFIRENRMTVTRTDFRDLPDFKIREASYSIDKRLRFDQDKLESIPSLDKGDKGSGFNLEIMREMPNLIEEDINKLGELIVMVQNESKNSFSSDSVIFERGKYKVTLSNDGILTVNDFPEQFFITDADGDIMGFAEVMKVLKVPKGWIGQNFRTYDQRNKTLRKNRKDFYKRLIEMVLRKLIACLRIV
ncbi:hypothetical protein CONCODRAFT_68471 [Conidiobolus coronatus NRRL 28638]|uniref:Uncharacterized protein n=1 Tax=Conidiobolus coronatus (strain ATCC 28846 / CBS 209.66 / NRRL 28638) TaxID=796925 RepID=A0A137PDY9_CONC2|nr:hypothetical protein CONCODRAFT_68471 [Conidiobolus coronatus NRRL 28638]|eukprot:KXN73216.1 hypothetical protein CONCODRAFT_68471 [Conidiobolus coronatus NRRL 28638]